MEGMRNENISTPEEAPEKQKISQKEYNLKQFEIAKSVYQKMHDTETAAEANADQIWDWWVNTGYNDSFREIVLSDSFAKHEKYQSEILNIEPEDIIGHVSPDSRWE